MRNHVTPEAVPNVANAPVGAVNASGVRRTSSMVLLRSTSRNTRTADHNGKDCSAPTSCAAEPCAATGNATHVASINTTTDTIQTNAARARVRWVTMPVACLTDARPTHHAW